jgi:hypothetical protein
MFTAIISFILGAVASWIVTRYYAQGSSKELQAVNHALRADNSELKKLVEKLPSDVREIVGQDNRTTLTVDEMSDLLRDLNRRYEKRPIIQVAYSWRENEPKDKPFTIMNAGDEEARNVRIGTIGFLGREFTFEPIGQLVPGSSVTSEPRASANVGLLFRTLIDAVEHAITARAREIKTVAPVDTETLTRFGDMIDAEQQAIDEFSHVPVVVTYEDRHHASTTMHYQLNAKAFGHVSQVTLELLREE